MQFSGPCNGNEVVPVSKPCAEIQDCNQVVDLLSLHDDTWYFSIVQAVTKALISCSQAVDYAQCKYH